VTTTPWHQNVAQRVLNRGSAELSNILAGPPPGVLAATGGFPHASTFPAEALEEIVTRLVRDDPAVALQYAPTEGIPSVREYLRDRQADLQGRRPEPAELIVTSGGMECIDLVSRTLINSGDDVAVEGPTYLGALMAFAGYQANLTAIPMDEDGMCVDILEERLGAGYRPKFIYTIPEYQNPSGRTLTHERRLALIEICRRYGVGIFEDIAYREISFDGTSLPSLWALAPDVVVQAGTFSKTLVPGVRLGWAAGPADLIDHLAAGKQNTDQCAGALGQRLLEEYGRAGLFEKHLPDARKLYASRWGATERALQEHMPDGCSWSEPTGGFFTWLTLAAEIDTVAMRDAAIDAGVAYVPGSPFYVDDGGRNELRFSFSRLDEEQLGLAVERLSGVVRTLIRAVRA
jgi:2-aminoadipate transaminase